MTHSFGINWDREKKYKLTVRHSSPAVLDNQTFGWLNHVFVLNCAKTILHVESGVTYKIEITGGANTAALDWKLDVKDDVTGMSFD